MRIHYIQNDPLATLGYIEEWAKEGKHSLTCTKMYENEELPGCGSFDLLIILGGRMGAYQENEYPWLITEKQFIRQAIEEGKFVLGICLGVQLLANALGSRVYPHAHQEVGWWPIELSGEASDFPLFNGVPKSFVAFEHHGDTFDLPAGAVRLASSKGCTNQAFAYGERVVGLQFHPEFTEDVICSLTSDPESQVVPGEFTQDPDSWGNQGSLLDGAKSVLFTVLDNIARAIQAAV
ncbi:type 1 glutamine amidotransferase [Peribacillus sp. SCS-155]|uniref:type 1 glutamine amidotransferase n=1 Tax=Peribacillus sedimenti TaxID=3115297 RepID=UPI003905FEEB